MDKSILATQRSPVRSNKRKHADDEDMSETKADATATMSSPESHVSPQKRARVSFVEATSPASPSEALSRADSDGVDPGGLQEDASFFDLIATFSRLPILEESKPEPCPVCNEMLPLSEFAKHVMGCVNRIDTESDAQLALSLSKQRGYLQPGAELEFQKPVFCPDGSSCQRKDYQHFEQVIHPPVNCPVCEDEIAVQEVDAHLNVCLNSKAPHKPKRSKRGPMAESKAMEEGDGAGTGGLSTSASGAVPRRSRSHDFLGRPRLSRAQLAAMSQIIIAQQEDNAAGRARKATGGAAAAASAPPRSPPPGIADEGEGEAEGAGEEAEAEAEGDQPLLDLLDTFKTLGFTREALSQELKAAEAEQRERQLQQQGTSAASADTPFPALSLPPSADALFRSS